MYATIRMSLWHLSFASPTANFIYRHKDNCYCGITVCGLTWTEKGDEIINKGLQIRFVSISCMIDKIAIGHRKTAPVARERQGRHRRWGWWGHSPTTFPVHEQKWAWQVKHFKPYHMYTVNRIINEDLLTAHNHMVQGCCNPWLISDDHYHIHFPWLHRRIPGQCSFSGPDSKQIVTCKSQDSWPKMNSWCSSVGQTVNRL